MLIQRIKKRKLGAQGPHRPARKHPAPRHHRLTPATPLRPHPRRHIRYKPTVVGLAPGERTMPHREVRPAASRSCSTRSSGSSPPRLRADLGQPDHRRARRPKGAFYHHFSSKEDLVEALARLYAEDAAARAPSVLDPLDAFAQLHFLSPCATQTERRRAAAAFPPLPRAQRTSTSAPARRERVPPILLIAEGVADHTFDTPDPRPPPNHPACCPAPRRRLYPPASSSARSAARRRIATRHRHRPHPRPPQGASSCRRARSRRCLTRPAPAPPTLLRHPPGLWVVLLAPPLADPRPPP